MLIYVEQLERTEDDGDVEVMTAQSVCDLIGIGLLTTISDKEYWKRTKDRTDAKTGMNVSSAIKPDLATLEYYSFSLTFQYQSQ